MSLMHNKKNTNVQIIANHHNKLPDQKKSDERCVLLTTGSFNPIHRGHIENLLKVKEFLEESHSMNVLAAYISPTHKDYVVGKLGQDYISSEDRCKLCEEAIQHEGLKHFIAVSRAEIECPFGFRDFDDVTKSLAKFLNSSETKQELANIQPIKVVYVCGLDHFNKCPYVAHLTNENNIACAVIYRLGASDQQIKKIHKSKNVYYIPLDENRSNLIDISSTAIRKCFQAHDYDELKELSYDCVRNYYENLNKSKNKE